MWHVYAFALLFLVSSVLALAIGRAPERIVAATLILASVLSVSSHAIRPKFVHPDVLLLCIDLASTVAVGAVAMRANRTWPIYVTALMAQMDLGHLLRIADPTLVPWLYWLTSSFWGYPIQLILMIATIRHRRNGSVPGKMSWSKFSRGPTQASRQDVRSARKRIRLDWSNAGCVARAASVRHRRRYQRNASIGKIPRDYVFLALRQRRRSTPSIYMDTTD